MFQHSGLCKYGFVFSDFDNLIRGHLFFCCGKLGITVEDNVDLFDTARVCEISEVGAFGGGCDSGDY